jgi:Zn-dependent protease
VSALDRERGRQRLENRYTGASAPGWLGTLTDYAWDGGEDAIASQRPRKRQNAGFVRRQMAWILLVMTCLSTLWAGITAWSPVDTLIEAASGGSLLLVRRQVLANFSSGLLFSVSLIAILSAHELGHYFATKLYGIRATPPMFIPFPFNPIGTCGAVILMDAYQADRRQIFDIGLAGPLAGLVVAIPVMALGLLSQNAPAFTPFTTFQIQQPLLGYWLAGWFQPELLNNAAGISNADLDPMVMAAWVGLLITGLNMMPVSQLDGGHVLFGLLGRRAVWFAILAYLAAVAYVVINRQTVFSLMLVLILFMGLRHPPSSNDDRTLGWPRTLLGLASLSIPLLCIPAQPFVFLAIPQ